MKSGTLRHLLVFERLTETKDESLGGVTETWTDDFSAFGEIVSGKAEEIFETQRRNALATWPQYTSSETYVFRIRQHDGINSLTHRIRFNGKIFNISQPILDNRRREMLITAIAVSIHAD